MSQSSGYFVPPSFLVACAVCGKVCDLCGPRPEGRKFDLGDRYVCIECQDKEYLEQCLEPYRMMATVALEAAEWFDNTRDCTCGDVDETECWYRLTDEQRQQERIDYIAKQLEHLVILREVDSE